MAFRFWSILVLTAVGGASSRADFFTLNRTEHADLRILFDGTTLGLDFSFEERVPEAEFNTHEVFNYIQAPFGRHPVPMGSGSTFAFTGVAPGGTFFRSTATRLDPIVSGPNLPEIGISAGEDAAGDPTSPFNMLASTSLQLVGVNGPGHFSLYTDGLFGPDVFMSTVTGADTLPVAIFGHEDYNFAFSQTGYYELTFRARAQFNAANGGGSIQSGEFKIYFGVEAEVAPAPATIGLAAMLIPIAFRLRRIGVRQ